MMDPDLETTLFLDYNSQNPPASVANAHEDWGTMADAIQKRTFNKLLVIH